MRLVLAGLEDRRTSERAAIIIRGILDDLDAIDYTKYYSSVKRCGANTGTEQKQFSDFSVRAIRAVKVCTCLLIMLWQMKCYVGS